MTDEHYIILKEYFCVYFTGYYKVDYLCLPDDMVLTYILWAELTVIYSKIYFKFTSICVIMILLNKTK